MLLLLRSYSYNAGHRDVTRKFPHYRTFYANEREMNFNDVSPRTRSFISAAVRVTIMRGCRFFIGRYRSNRYQQTD